MTIQIQRQIRAGRSLRDNLLKLSSLSTVCLNTAVVLCVAPAIAAQPDSATSSTEVKATPFHPSASGNGDEGNAITVHGPQDRITTSASDLLPVERSLTPAPSTGNPAALYTALSPREPASTWLAGITDATTFVNASSLEIVQESGGSNPSPTPTESPSTQPSGTPSETPTTQPTETPTETPTMQPPQSSAPQTSNKWHFLFTPYIYLPVTIYGDATVKGFTSNVTLPPSEVFSAIRNTFEFGLTGKVEAWTPNYRFGVLLNGDYIEQGRENNFTRPNPNRLLDLAIDRVANRIRDRVDDVLRQQVADYLLGRLDDRIQQELEARLGARLEQIIPSQFRSNLQVQTWNVDLAFAYRFYNESQVNPKGVATEFDLGPFVANALVGVRIGGISSDLDVETNLGGEGSFSRSVTLAQPLLGARFRYRL